MSTRPQEMPGQLSLVCESCDGGCLILSDDTPPELCQDCDGTGLDPDAVFIHMVVRGFYQEARWDDVELDNLRPRAERISRQITPSAD